MRASNVERAENETDELLPSMITSILEVLRDSNLMPRTLSPNTHLECVEPVSSKID